jgi:hypothetical protein
MKTSAEQATLMTRLIILGQASIRLVLLTALALGVLWFLGMPFFIQEIHVLTGSGLAPASYRLATWGNTLLAAATVLYVANLYFSLDRVGMWATRLAEIGAAVLVADVGAHLLGLVPAPLRGTQYSYVDFYDMISVLVPMAVIWYLVVERVNRNRTAGALVMPVILCFIGLEIWLLAEHAGNRSVLISGFFRDYWGHAYLLAHIIGYGAFVLAAAAGVLHLVRVEVDRHGIRHPIASRLLPDAWRAQQMMISSISVGVPVFALALFLAIGWGLGSETWKTYAWVNDLWIAAVLTFYGVLLHRLFTRNMPGHRLAWWSVVGLGVTLAAFLGAEVLTLGMPAAPNST